MDAPRHIALAAHLATRSTHRQHHHAAIVLRGGAIVATGYNHGDRHAEAVAIGKLWPSKRIGCVVWSSRFTRRGDLALAKPCKRCERALRIAGIRCVHYSTALGFERIDLGESQ